MRRLFLALLAGLFGMPAHAVPSDWTTPLAPFRISGNLYYVGSRDLAAYLVATPQGHILINANLESSPPLIRASVEQLGFRWSDVRILLNGQAHNDHVSGSARILRETGARQMVMAGDDEVVRTGGAAEYDRSLLSFPASRVDRVLHDGETVTLGGTTLTAHKTAGHTRGCTTWTLQTREGVRTYQVVIIGGWALNPGLRLVAAPGQPTAYPGIAQDFERTFVTLRALPCDIFLGAHGGYFGLLEKLERMPREGSAVWVDPSGYRDAVDRIERAFRKEYARQASGG